MKFRHIYLFFALIGVLVLAACGNGESENNGEAEENAEAEGSAEADAAASEDGETYEFRLGHIAPDDHIWNEGANKLAEELEERSGGRMTMEIYPGGQLGNDADMMQQIQSGSLDFGLITNAHLTSESDAFSAWFAPFLFDSYEEALEASNTELAAEILATLDGQGVKAMDYMFSGHRTMMFTEKVESPEDISGLTLRVTPSPALEDWYRMLGASPESIPLPDVYQSAQTGVIDGMEMDLDAAVTSNFNEVTGYGAMTNHMVWPSVMVMNENLYEGMSEEDQAIVEESMAAASEYGTMERASLEEEYIETLTDRGMELYNMEDGAFDSYIEEFDAQYRELDPLIDEFIGEFR
ncbi:TRAP transporter substrate-binding protein [Salinicoccus halitifaciens]|uniref:Tripartite ATP-independent transporter DctP family solute receptor n=1 Tax=Salinicoccus halitifaciens TaxID=1073415 RepID=A0ABV2E7Y8_9STAP|nr:TRAP transporter substrate-binding protein [Salinicoccus halitifaciens]MCD2136412.1 TRAP transporter substrate-binding protein [Salinicoccus halitifaciens]